MLFKLCQLLRCLGCSLPGSLELHTQKLHLQISAHKLLLLVSKGGTKDDLGTERRQRHAVRDYYVITD